MTRDPQPRRTGEHDAKKAAEPIVEKDDEFQRAMADVVPLPPDPRGRVRPARPVHMPEPPSDAVPAPRDASLLDDEDADGSYAADGVDRRELRKLKRGVHAAGSRLDVHGQTAAEAVATVKRFIDGARHRHRTVCIVHGKGLHSGGNVAVLKTRVRAFLRQQHVVLAYTDAPRTDGGGGAVYVLLRK